MISIGSNHNFDDSHDRILYHGTDLRLVEMDETKYYETINRTTYLINEMWMYLEQYYLAKNGAFELFNQTKDLLLCLNFYRYSDYWVKKLNYGRAIDVETYNVVLTEELSLAIEYAHRAQYLKKIGIIATVFYKLLDFIRPRKWMHSSRFDDLITKIEQFSSSLSTPVIYKLNDINERSLKDGYDCIYGKEFKIKYYEDHEILRGIIGFQISSVNLRFWEKGMRYAYFPYPPVDSINMDFEMRQKIYQPQLEKIQNASILCKNTYNNSQLKNPFKDEPRNIFILNFEDGHCRLRLNNQQNLLL